MSDGKIEAQIFFPNLNRLNLVIDAVQACATVQGENPANLTRELRFRPLLRLAVMRAVEEEMSVAGINWDAIGDFLTKIAPLIIEIIKMFM